MGTMHLDGEEYVVLPKAEYERLLSGKPRNEALEYALASIGRDLKAAREHAGLKQSELAAKLGKAQTTVSQSEAGKIRVSEEYVRAVLKACGLPKNWKAPT